jgi:hypothetical protein
MAVRHLKRYASWVQTVQELVSTKDLSALSLISGSSESRGKFFDYF